MTEPKRAPVVVGPGPDFTPHVCARCGAEREVHGSSGECHPCHREHIGNGTLAHPGFDDENEPDANEPAEPDSDPASADDRKAE